METSVTPRFLKKSFAMAALLGLALGAAAQTAFPAKTINYVVPYDAAKAYAPVLLVGTVPHLLVVATAAPYQSVQELVAAAKARPGTLSFASGGNGTILQMQGELLRLQIGTQMIHVPYKGDTPALQNVMGGQATFVFVPIAAALPQVLAGKVRALAITAAQRTAALPQVPTMAEAGFKDFVVEQWQAIYAPAGTPPAVLQRLNSEINTILKDREVVASFDKLGVSIVGGTPQQLAERQKADSERWGRVIKAAGIKLD